jgi:hypothetical protein
LRTYQGLFPYPPGGRPRSGRWARLFSVFLVLAALTASALAVLTVRAAPARADTPLNTPFITWNMRGGTTSGLDMWGNYIPRVLSQVPGTQVVMLQEAGAEPPGSRTILANPTGDGRVIAFTWTGNTGSVWYCYFVYSVDTDAPGGRVNTVIMSRTRPADVMVVDSGLPGRVPTRLAIGIRLGNDWYFSYHALAGGGGDAVSMLTAIDRSGRGNRRTPASAGPSARTSTPIRRLWPPATASPRPSAAPNLLRSSIPMRPRIRPGRNSTTPR